MGTTDTTAAVGLDVSKDTLDGCLLAADGTSRAKGFPNTPAGFAALLVWADRHAGGCPLHFGMEATGPYSQAPAEYLHAAGRLVSVVSVCPLGGGGSNHFPPTFHLNHCSRLEDPMPAKHLRQFHPRHIGVRDTVNQIARSPDYERGPSHLRS